MGEDREKGRFGFQFPLVEMLASHLQETTLEKQFSKQVAAAEIVVKLNVCTDFKQGVWPPPFILLCQMNINIIQVYWIANF